MPSSKLRVVIVGLHYAPESTGNAPYTTSLAEGLAAAGYDVHVITGYPHYPEWRLRQGYSGWSRDESINGVSVHRVRHYIPAAPNAFQRMHMELSFGVRALVSRWGRPQVVLLVSPALFSSAVALLKARLGSTRPSIALWVQDIYSRGLAETGGDAAGAGWTSKMAARFESLVFSSCDGVVAIHNRFKQYMVEALHVDATRVNVIRNWTHLRLVPGADRNETRASLGWDQSDVIALHSGNMGKKQGLDNLVAAARLAQQRNSQVRFILMGDGNQRGRLETLSEGISSIAFVPSLPAAQFQQALAAADVLIVNELPGVRDMSVPSKLTSYFNSGTPVVAATDEGSVTADEIAVSGGGVRVDAADPAALLEAVEFLHQHPDTSALLGANGLRFRHETLSESAAIAQYDEFISSLASSRDH